MGICQTKAQEIIYEITLAFITVEQLPQPLQLRIYADLMLTNERKELGLQSSIAPSIVEKENFSAAMYEFSELLLDDYGP